MMGRWDIANPLTADGRPVSKERAKYIRKLIEVGRNSKKKMRSGNPAVRAEATRVHDEVPGMIRQVYLDDMMEG